MKLPSSVDYQGAIQNPGLAFRDPDLKQGTIESNSFGIPVARSGGFAITYKVDSKTSQRAVRLFHRHSPNLADQYDQITRFFGSRKMVRFLDFEYQPDGIMVLGQHYPLVKMRWSNSPTLGKWLEQNYSQSENVRQLSRNFASAIQDLEQFGVAHGDLQHGNILVGNDITFIDYDGMFVPGMYRSQSTELGHRNYQSQLRTARDVGPHIDRFSSYVISLSLDAISLNPGLYEKHCSGENLLFTASDFVDPLRSELFAKLKGIPAIRSRTENLELACLTELEYLPTLADFNSSHSGLTKSRASGVITTPLLHQYEIILSDDHYTMTNRLGSVVTVVGRITEVTREKTTLTGQPCRFLNFGSWKSNTFYAPIWSESLNALEKMGRNPSEFECQWVSITGILESYKGRPQIQITEAASINLLDGEDEARRMLSEWSSQVQDINNRQTSARAKLPPKRRDSASPVPRQQVFSKQTESKGASVSGLNQDATTVSPARSKLPPIPTQLVPKDISKAGKLDSKSTTASAGTAKNQQKMTSTPSNTWSTSQSQASPAVYPSVAVSPQRLSQRDDPKTPALLPTDHSSTSQRSDPVSLATKIGGVVVTITVIYLIFSVLF